MAGYLLNPQLIVRGCPCHLTHFAAVKAAQKVHYHFDEILVDIYYYHEENANRKKELREFQSLCDIEHHRILKHVCTRWLSLGKCLQRLIEQWRPLKQYFTKNMRRKVRNLHLKQLDQLVVLPGKCCSSTVTTIKKKSIDLEKN